MIQFIISSIYICLFIIIASVNEDIERTIKFLEVASGVNFLTMINYGLGFDELVSGFQIEVSLMQFLSRDEWARQHGGELDIK